MKSLEIVAERDGVGYFYFTFALKTVEVKMTDAFKAALEQYPAVGLLGFMTVALVLALVLIGAVARLVQSLAALKQYGLAVKKVQEIEENLMEMTATAREVQMDYERSLAQEKAAHEREIFGMQQIIFERNGEILTLKSDILEMRRNQGHMFDVPPR